MRADHGRRVYAVFDKELDASTVRAEDFSLTDEDGVEFIPFAAVLTEDALRVRLDFSDFNGARGPCRLCYVPGTLVSLAGETVPETAYVFHPVRLSGAAGEAECA